MRPPGTAGLTYVGGIEVECHILKITDPLAGLTDCTQPATAPAVEALRHDYQYYSENMLDQLEPVITPTRHALIGVGLPLRILDPSGGQHRSRSHSTPWRMWPLLMQ